MKHWFLIYVLATAMLMQHLGAQPSQKKVLTSKTIALTITVFPGKPPYSSE